MALQAAYPCSAWDLEGRTLREHKSSRPGYSPLTRTLSPNGSTPFSMEQKPASRGDKSPDWTLYWGGGGEVYWCTNEEARLSGSLGDPASMLQAHKAFSTPDRWQQMKRDIWSYHQKAEGRVGRDTTCLGEKHHPDICHLCRTPGFTVPWARIFLILAELGVWV